MHYLKKLASMLFIALSMATFSARADEQQATPEIIAAQAEEQSTLSAEQSSLITSITNQTHRLRLILTAIIQKNDPATIKNIPHQEVSLWALGIQQFLKEVHELPATSLVNIAIKAHANRYCAENISAALATNLKTLPTFAPELCLQQMKQVTDFHTLFPTLLALETDTSALLTKLEPVVKNLGLHVGNKITRQTEILWRNCSNNPWVKYISTATALGLASWYAYRWLQAEHSYINKVGQEATQANSERTKEFIAGILTGAASHAPIAMGSSLLYSGKETVTHEWSLIKTKLSSGWNKLKGVESILDAAGYQAIDDATVTFHSEELIGLEEQMRDIAPILDCCSDLEDFVRRGNSPQFGTLLIGPSGCGKTLFSQALAGTIHRICKTNGKNTKVTFKDISCFDLVRFSLRDHIADARKQGGVVVLFIDEIHNLSMQTTKSSLTLNDFLTQMADLYKTDVPNSYVFLIAATNQPELLGTSLLVPGRFGKIIRFSYPNSSKRTDLFTKLLPRAGINSEDVDIASLVRQTAGGVSFGKLRSLINEARIKAEGAGEVVGQKHLQEAIDTLIHRFKHTMDLNSAERKTIAAYQAGKALTYTLLASNLNVERITIGGINDEVKEVNEYGEKDKLNPNKNSLYTPSYGAIITYRQQEALQADDILEQKKQCKALVAGSCAQDLLLHTHSATYNATDMHHAVKLAQEITLDGKRFEDLSENRQNAVKDAAEELVATYQQEMHLLLTAHKDALAALAAKLEADITISGDDAKEILKQFVI